MGGGMAKKQGTDMFLGTVGLLWVFVLGKMQACGLGELRTVLRTCRGGGTF